MCKNVLTLLIFLTFEIFSFFFWKDFFFFFNLFYLQSNYSLKYVVQKVKTEPTSKTFTKCNFGLLDKVWINFPIKLSVKKKNNSRRNLNSNSFHHILQKQTSEFLRTIQLCCEIVQQFMINYELWDDKNKSKKLLP